MGYFILGFFLGFLVCFYYLRKSYIEANNKIKKATAMLERANRLIRKRY